MGKNHEQRLRIQEEGGLVVQWHLMPELTPTVVEKCALVRRAASGK